MDDTIVSLEISLEDEISQEEEGKDNIQELMLIAAITQELSVETKVGLKESDEEKLVDITATTQALAVKMEVDKKNKETVIKPTDKVVVTQELAAEVGQFQPQEAATPLIDDAFGGMSGPI